MKNITYIIGMALVVLFAVQSHAQEPTKKTVETSIVVKGACNQCKERIENAAYIKGVKYAEWDKETKKLKLAYRSDKVSLDSIEYSIVKAGHDVGEKKADEEVYHALPACCKYRSEHIHTH